MAIFQYATRKCLVIFLLLVAFNGSLLTHGRQIKPLNQQHSSLNNDTVVKHSVNNVPTHPSSGKKKVVDSSSVVPKYGVESFGDSMSSDTNAFRPTTPGNSPGVGHRKFAPEDKDVEAMVASVQSPDHVKVYVTEGTQNQDGFKPTNPGHSPGVGHAQQNKIGQ
ncbi:hypothetical protein AAZX31_17G169600 [Glycine max]|uniref:Uncharacterized protein n=2 Tax=Glycine subgen. Soja TaxID=1462606 RepID=I1MVZ6_SOYBN|nr:precursor of CEP9 [Glycine max]XP_028211758.1 precursor of CEP9-like [Glycine soja]KAG4930811.1 hypothetical protein JHK86_047772 [Glycine max]KAG5102824.1 hypothetical protein JHK84_047793 [Glycine max]KAH1118924.1 hypothetical protein GYH30_047634 [Glycine max]KAH1202715.1 Precursor of CEP9 [Glycine max]KHN28806.1 hypothetical protein glysoja_042164 [Glycine soja]|eukprot:XP_014625649.1 precursor of CEP9 [Glycine max]